ncbi:hypothetical protein CMV_012566 [Castanea mollissima]|uniref:Uncharacterized protein n=1 Tax=Castanea mollissima TaxID=60419 RepID=A0A8J4R9B1_9ROSI|nr:hypothetical protein CMV_012566 [Castanea mollissima]
MMVLQKSSIIFQLIDMELIVVYNLQFQVQGKFVLASLRWLLRLPQQRTSLTICLNVLRRAIVLAIVFSTNDGKPFSIRVSLHVSLWDVSRYMAM